MEITAPTGYKSQNTETTKKYFKFTVPDTFVVSYPTANGFYTGSTSSQGLIGYDELPGKLKVVRNDDAAKVAANNVTYAIYTKDGTGYKEVTTGITKTNGGKIGTDATNAETYGSVTFSGLDWSKEYYVKETTTATATYTPDESGYYGPYKVGAEAADRKPAADTTEEKFTVDSEALTWTVTITPSKKQGVTFKYETEKLGTTGTSTPLAGTFTVKDTARTETTYTGFELVIPASGTVTDSTNIMTKHTYKVTKAADGVRIYNRC